MPARGTPWRGERPDVGSGGALPQGPKPEAVAARGAPSALREERPAEGAGRRLVERPTWDRIGTGSESSEAPCPPAAAVWLTSAAHRGDAAIVSRRFLGPPLAEDAGRPTRKAGRTPRPRAHDRGPGP